VALWGRAMNADVLALGVRNIRSTDSNSLLRLYDQARILCQRSDSPQERARADRLLQLLGTELRKRKVPL
jgi:hypothetical protein